MVGKATSKANGLSGERPGGRALVNRLIGSAGELNTASMIIGQRRLKHEQSRDASEWLEDYGAGVRHGRLTTGLQVLNVRVHVVDWPWRAGRGWL